MNTKQIKLIENVMEYLKENKIPYQRIEDTKNLLVLKSSGDYHYMAVMFFTLPHEFLSKTRYFKVKYIDGRDYKKTINEIKLYVNGN